MPIRNDVAAALICVALSACSPEASSPDGSLTGSTGRQATNRAGDAAESTACVFPNQPDQAAPDWVCGIWPEGYGALAVGSATPSGAGSAFGKSMATAQARHRLAETLAPSTAAETILTGSRVLRSTTSPDGTIYVLVGVD